MQNVNLNHCRADCAKTMLGLFHQAHAGHIGSALSCLEILVDLCFRRMHPEDQLILSKGHAAAALYTVLAKSGRLDETELASFYRDGTRLAAHPPCNRELPAIPFGTGSLGHGLSLASGLVLAQRFTARKFQAYCVLSDGDCNEGSTWEAAMFAAHQRLGSLTVIVDANGLQGFGGTGDVLDMEPLADKWRAFGFITETAAAGNDFADLEAAHRRLREAPNAAGRPKCLIARTIKGHGVSFMENQLAWHYLPMDEAQYRQAIQETEALDA